MRTSHFQNTAMIAKFVKAGEEYLNVAAWKCCRYCPSVVVFGGETCLESLQSCVCLEVNE